MQAQCSGVVEQHHPAKKELLAELHTWERQLVLRSLDEAIRLIESGKAEKLTREHIHYVAEYHAIKVDGEWFFDKAFSGGKEVAVCLAIAMDIGWRETLDDMLRLRLTVLASGACAETGAPRSHPDGSAAIPSCSPT
jgi:hypothetical protein